MNVEKTHSCRREQDKEPVGYMRQQQHIYFFLYFFIHTPTSLLLNVAVQFLYLFPLSSHPFLSIACPSLFPPLASPIKYSAHAQLRHPFSSPPHYSTPQTSWPTVSSLCQCALKSLKVWAISAESAWPFFTGYEAYCWACFSTVQGVPCRQDIKHSPSLNMLENEDDIPVKAQVISGQVAT